MRVCKSRILAATALSIAIGVAPIKVQASFSKKPLIELRWVAPMEASERQQLTDLMTVKKNFQRTLIGFKKNIGEYAISTLQKNDKRRFAALTDLMNRKDNRIADRQTIELDLDALISSRRSFTRTDIESAVVGITITNMGRLRRISKTPGGREFLFRVFVDLTVIAPGKKEFLGEFKAWAMSDENFETLAKRLSAALAR